MACAPSSSSVTRRPSANYASAIHSIAPPTSPDGRSDLRDQLDRQVQRFLPVQKGARIVTGGHSLPGRGFFYAPTLITDTDPSMEVVAEETFGPVAPILRARDAEDALRIANDSRYGLAAII